MDKNDISSHQFPGGGPLVVVRNTFLDVEPCIQPPALMRAKTAPPAGSKVEEDSEEEDEEEEGGDDQAPLPDVPPQPEAALRQTTRDWVEDGRDWQWSGVMANPPIATAQPAPMAGQVPVQMPPAGTVPVAGEMPGVGQPMMYAAPANMQMVFVPVSMAGPMNPEVPGQAVPFAPQDGGAPTQLPLQRPDNAARHARWPAQDANPISITQAPLETFQAPAASSGGDSLGGGGASAEGSSGVPPQPQTLTRTFSINSACFRVHWTVDARKLRGNDKQAVSPPFELSFGSQFPNVTFKMMIYPKVVNDSKGGASFKKAKGKGYVQLKCEAELAEAIANVSFRISIGSGERQEEARGPVSHNFSSSAVCGLPKDQEEWDFQSVVDSESMTFVVCLEIVPKAARG